MLVPKGCFCGGHGIWMRLSGRWRRVCGGVTPHGAPDGLAGTSDVRHACMTCFFLVDRGTCNRYRNTGSGT
jgi:hypothetical protein